MKLLFVCHGNICRSPMAEFVMKELLSRAGRDDITVESVTLDDSVESVEPGEKLEGADNAIFRDAIENYKHARVGSKKWIKARDAFKDVYKRHPEFFHAGFKHATMLQEEGEISGVVKVAEKIASEHPKYAYAQAALVQSALDAEDLAKEERLMRGYRPTDAATGGVAAYDRFTVLWLLPFICS